MKTAADMAHGGLCTISVALLLLALPVAAQQQNPPEQPPGTEQDGETTTPEPAAAATEPAPAENEDPFDYEASEQISEDLSVSFPVDI